MKENFQTFLKSCVYMMLKPIALFCITRGVRFQDFIEIAKKAFVENARNKLNQENNLISVSKLSVMTGIQRPEVNRILENPDTIKSKDFIVKIIGQWSEDKKFLYKNKPKKLSTEGTLSEFAALVHMISKDLNPHTVRFELERLGLVETKNGLAKLINPVYITNGDPKNTLRLGSYDIEDLLVSLQENAFSSNDVPNLQARTEYDNIPDEEIDSVRLWFLDAGARLHEEARKFLSKLDRDTNRTNKKGTGKNRVVIGTYSRVESLSEKEPKKGQ